MLAMASATQVEGSIWHRVNGVPSKKVKDKEVVSLRRPAALDLLPGSESPDNCTSPNDVQKSAKIPVPEKAPQPARMQVATKTPVKDFANPALSDDLLASVLLYLTSSKDRAAFSQVCKRWCQLEAGLHTRIRFPGGKQLSDNMTQALIRFPNLIEITVDERAVKRSFWRKGNASKAALEGAMRQVAVNCPRLEKLNFYSCPTLTDKTLQYVVGECASLRSLRLVRCEKVGKSHKKRFKSSGVFEFETGSQRLETGSPHFVTACASNLVQLNLYGTCVDDATVAAIAHYCKSLERLSLAGCHDVTDAGLKVLGEGCKKLQDLNVVRCWRITDKGLAAIGEGCGGSIKFLSLGFHSEVHDRGMRALAVGCPNLELLAISDCNNVSDAGVRTVVRRCKNLRILKVTACLQVKDVSLEIIGRLATSLEILELRSLIVSDRALLHLSAAGGSAALKRIVLAGCPYISDKGLLALANQESFALKSVDVRHCREISTPALAKFMVRCTTLEQMDVDKGRTEELDEELRKLRASMV